MYPQMFKENYLYIQNRAGEIKIFPTVGFHALDWINIDETAIVYTSGVIVQFTFNTFGLLFKY